MTDIQQTSVSFDWEEIEEEPITAVLAQGAMRLTNGDLACDAIALVLGSRAIVLRVSLDTDEVIVSLENAFTPEVEDWRPLEQLAEVVSRTVGWCWLARNYRGYVDTFTLGLDGIDPSLSFIGVGATLWCTRVTPIAA